MLLGGISCNCQLDDGSSSTACNGDSRVTTTGSGTTCSLMINGPVTPEDAGQYKCALADRSDMQTVSRTMDVMVSMATS